MDRKKKVLIIEDELVIALDIKYSLESKGFEVCDFISSAEEALTRLDNIKPDIIVIDIVLEGMMDGIELAEIINEKYQIPIIYITALDDKKTYQDAQKTRPVCFLVKPYGDKELLSWVNIALEQSEKQKKVRN